MTKRIAEIPVGELARLSGVTVRTLHHYDAIGLLRPTHVQANGYRTYGRAELLRLQEILFYRAFGLSLAEIRDVLDDEAGALARLTAHRARLAAQVTRTQDLLDTLDRTIATLKGDDTMTDANLYAPFSPAKQADYEAWLIAAYGEGMVDKIAASRSAVVNMPKGTAGAMRDLEEIESALVTSYEVGLAPDDKALVPELDRHRALIAGLWGRPCPPDAYAGLARMYEAHPDFVARYERLAPRFSRWLPDAMRAYAAGSSA